MIRRLDALRSTVAELERQYRAGGGNPNHDPADGKFTTGPGGAGHGKHHAGRRRRKRRLKQKLRELKVKHKVERHTVADKQRERHARHREYYAKRKASLSREHGRDLQKMDAEHAREVNRIERHREKERAHEAVQKAKGKVRDEDIAGWEAGHAREVASVEESNARIREKRLDWHQGERNNLRDERREAAVNLKDRHVRERRKTLARQRDERTEAIEEHGFKRKDKAADAGRMGPLCGVGVVLRGGDGGGNGSRAAAGRAAAGRAMSLGRTHKASNAEAILRYCLRKLGLSAAYRHDELTGDQALEVLDAVRDYSRDWLRHETEALIRHYGRAIDATDQSVEFGRGKIDGVDGSVRLDAGTMSGIAEGIRGEVSGWIHGESGDHDGGEMGGEMGGETRSLSSAMRHHVGRFFDRVRGFVRESILAGAMALSGPEGLTPDDLAEADRQHGVQVAYLDQFRDDVEMRTPAELSEPLVPPLAGRMTAPEMAARAEMYGSAAWGAAHEINRRGVIKDGKAIRERRYHWRPKADDHPCATCAAESAKGWVPVGTLLKIGDSECLGIGCDCYFTFALNDGSIFITRRGWRKAA